MSSFACVSNVLELFSFEGEEITPICRSELPIVSGDNLSALCWNHTNQVVATASTESKKIQLWQAANASLLSSIPFGKEELADTITGVAFSSSSRYIAAGVYSKVHVWDLKRRNLKAAFQHDSAVSALLYHQDSHIYSGDMGGVVRCWDLKAGECSGECAPINSTAACMTLTSSSRAPANLICGRRNGSLQVYDLSTLGVVRNMHIHSLDGITAICGSPRNSKLLTAVCKGEGKVSLIDITTGSSGPSGGTGSTSENLYQPSASISLFHARPTCVSCHENGFHVAIGCTGGQVLIYDWRNARAPVCEYQLPAGGEISGISFQNPLRPVPQATGSTPMATTGRSVTSSSVSQSPMPMTKAAGDRLEQASVVSDISSATLEREHQRQMAPTPTKGTEASTVTASPTAAAATPVTASTSVVTSAAGETDQTDSIAFGTTNILPLDSREQPPLLSPLPKQQNPIPAGNQTPTLRELKSPTIIQIAAAPISSNNTPLPSPHALASTPRQTQTQSELPTEQPVVPSPSSIYSSGSVASSLAPAPSRQSLPATTSPALDTVALQSYREAVRPVTQEFLQEALDGLRYDLHLEMQEVISEQIRQFGIAREESTAMMSQLMQQLQSLAEANEQLRSENNELRYAINKSKYSLQ